MGLFKEFKEFAVKGNVMDMAIGVVIGGAFGKIVTSLVSDIIMPLIGAVTGGLNFTEWKWVIREAVMEGINARHGRMHSIDSIQNIFVGNITADSDECFSHIQGSCKIVRHI